MKKTVQDRIAFLEERMPIPSRQKSTELTQEDKAALIKFVKFVEDLALAKGISLKQAWTSIGPILKRDRERERRTKNLKTLKALQKLQCLDRNGKSRSNKQAEEEGGGMEKDKMTPRQRAQRELIGLSFDAREASRREIIEGDRWAKHAGPNGPLQEVLHPETGSPNSDAA